MNPGVLGEWGPITQLCDADTSGHPLLCPPFAKRASGPKHYFHFTKARIATIEKEGRGRELCVLPFGVVSSHVHSRVFSLELG